MPKGDIRISIRKNNLSKIANSYPKKASQVVRKAGYEIIRQAAPLTPYKSGDLSSRVTVTMLSPVSATVNWEMFYAVYQNFGTRFMAGKFFANKAAAAVKPTFVAAMKDILKP